MSSLNLQDIAALSHKYADLSFGQVQQFISLASKLKDDILLAQPSSVPAFDPPDVLPPTITTFLQKSCGISVSCIDSCWEALKPTIWNDDNCLEDSITQDSDFATHGHPLGLYSRTLYPPQQTCINASCSRCRTGRLLKKEEQRQGVLYTLNKGALPVRSVHLYCDACNTNYHHNFHVKDGIRTYYDGIPDVIQLGEHQFAERRLIQLWITLMLVSWTSATNCARLYNLTLSDTVPPGDWAFGFTLTTEHVWDGFVILALMDDHQHRSKTLKVPHTGAQKDRFTEALQARNIRFRVQGQPELRHYCKKCLRVCRNGRKVWVNVIDGVTVGCPCCAIHNCKTPLESNRHRFCPKHAAQNLICAIIGCNSLVADDSRTCSDPRHQEVERIHRERGQGRFQLQDRLQRARVAHPNDAVGEEGNPTDGDVETEEFEIGGSDSQESQQKERIRAQFGRRRTHNEQIIVTPCGIIIARETFYGAEGVGSVIEMIKRMFSRDIKPDHIFFDNNCTLAKMVKDDPFFKDIGLTVDVFHFKSKHSETDIFCQEHCNPAAYPELISEDNSGWYFNSSIAEQTNVWLGGYHAICREMLVDKYIFFLDEMILRRNQMTREKLAKEGKSPENWPMDNKIQ